MENDSETISAKEVSDFIFERLMDEFYFTDELGTIDPKWVRERANNIAAGLQGLLIK